MSELEISRNLVTTRLGLSASTLGFALAAESPAERFKLLEGKALPRRRLKQSGSALTGLGRASSRATLSTLALTRPFRFLLIY